jgi:hypothetical protein
MYRRWIEELWAGRPIAAELVSDDFVGHWPDRDVHGPAELQAIIDETRNMLQHLTSRSRSGHLSTVSSSAAVGSAAAVSATPT